MSIPRYPPKISKYSSHNLVNLYIREVVQKLTIVNQPIRILDFGCSTGDLFDLIKDLKISYLGVEPFLEDAKIARMKGLEVLEISAEQVVQSVESSFDFLVFADVLEHLVDPFNVLSNSKKLLSRDGYIVVSCPNVANIFIRINLLFGNWNYEDRGILDRTHLRFYTVETLSSLIQNAGFEVLHMKFSSIPFEALGLRKKFLLAPLDLFYRLLVNLRPSLFSYQTIVLAKVQTN